MRYQRKKKMNPALMMMQEQAKQNLLISSSHQAYMLIALTVLHDKFGLGEKRINRFLDEFKELLDSYEKGYINANDLNDVLHDELGIQILTGRKKKQ